MNPDVFGPFDSFDELQRFIRDRLLARRRQGPINCRCQLIPPEQLPADENEARAMLERATREHYLTELHAAAFAGDDEAVDLYLTLYMEARKQ